MVGKIRTKEHCPRCKGKFEGEPLRCPLCLTTPDKYFIDISWPGQKRARLYCGPDGHPLDSWERASRLLTAIRYDVDRGKGFEPKDFVRREVRGLSFENYVEAWFQRKELEFQRGHITKGYLGHLKTYISKYFVPFFGTRSIRDIREGQIEDFRNNLPVELSHKTVANLMGCLHKIFEDAYRRHDILAIPWFPKLEREEAVTRWISEEEQRAVLAEMPDPVRYAFFLFLMKEGCRPSEARALRWEKVDFKNDMVVIAAAMDINTFKPYTKERNVRYLPLHPEVKDALQKLPRALNGFVFVLHGRQISKKTASDSWRRAAERAGVEVTCYEGTRHSLASQAINQGCSERIVGDMLGHKTLKSTRRYAKMKSESLKAVWGKVQVEGEKEVAKLGKKS